MIRTLLIAAIGLLAGCLWSDQPTRDAGLDYRGDGEFVDHGPGAAIRRYVLDLGKLDLATTGSREFSLAGLPAEELTVGLQVVARAEPREALYDTSPLGATLRLELVDEHGNALIAEEAPLTAWTWSGTGGEKSWSFVYLRGDTGGDSSFTARPGGSYKATFTVVRPDPGAAGYVVTARAFGGGWKVPEG